MRPHYNYNNLDKLSKIMGDPKLRPEKFGSWSSKHVGISQGMQVYYADYALLHLLKNKFGDIPFKEATEAYHAGK